MDSHLKQIYLITVHLCSSLTGTVVTLFTLKLIITSQREWRTAGGGEERGGRGKGQFFFPRMKTQTTLRN